MSNLKIDRGKPTSWRHLKHISNLKTALINDDYVDVYDVFFSFLFTKQVK